MLPVVASVVLVLMATSFLVRARRFRANPYYDELAEIAVATERFKTEVGRALLPPVESILRFLSTQLARGDEPDA